MHQTRPRPRIKAAPLDARHIDAVPSLASNKDRISNAQKNAPL